MATPAADIPSAAECVPNIGPRGRRFRYIAGGVALALALYGSIRVLVLRLPPLAMAGPGLAFFAAALCFFQAREKTCIFLAAIGQRDDDAEGPKRPAQEHLVLLKRQVGRVVLLTLGSGAAVTVLAVLLALWRHR